MKKLVLLLVLIASLGQHSFAQTIIDPTLAEEVMSEDQIETLRDQLDELGNISMQDIPPAEISMVDYEVTRIALQYAMKTEMKNYLESLGLIKSAVTRTLSELIALKRMVDQNGGENGVFKGEYTKDVILKIPKLNNTINDIYKHSIIKLFSLSNMAIIPVKIKQKSAVATDVLKNKTEMSFRNGVYSLCQTRLCLKRIAIDLMGWHAFVRDLNRNINFADFSNEMKWTKKSVNTTPLVTIAIIDAAKDLLKLELKSNKDYSISGLVAKTAENTIRLGAGVPILILAAPTYMIEKSSKVIAELLNFNVMKVNLALTPEDMYSFKVVEKGFNVEVMKFSEKLDSAMYIHEGLRLDVIEEKRGTLMQQAVKMFGKSIYDLGFISANDLDKYGLNNLNKYGLDNLNEYGVDNLDSYGLSNLEKYGLENIQKFGLVDLNRFGSDKLNEYGVDTIKLYGLENLKSYGLENIQKYGLEFLKKKSNPKVHYIWREDRIMPTGDKTVCLPGFAYDKQEYLLLFLGNPAHGNGDWDKYIEAVDNICTKIK